MKKMLTLTAIWMSVALTAPALAQDAPSINPAARADRIEQGLDREGNRIQNRHEHRVQQTREVGREELAERFDARGNRIEERLDRRGDRFDHQVERGEARVEQRTTFRTQHHIGGPSRGGRR